VVSHEDLRRSIESLATLDRASCSAGEHEAAERIAAALHERGATAHVERERVHGTHWWPLGITAALGVASAAAGRRGRRWLGGGLGTLGAVLVVDDLGAGRRWLRRLLPKQVTANVVARTGDPGAERMVLVVAHHDAAHSGFFFNPRIEELFGALVRRGGAGTPNYPRLMLPIAAGPALAGAGALLGLRRLSSLSGLMCAGIIASFVDIALRPVVPGANDNLTGVATILALAQALRDEPVSDLDVLLVSTGSEEALMEGMRAFAGRHFPDIDPGRAQMICVDTVGSPELVLAEAEGMLHVREYDQSLKALFSACAERLGVKLLRGVTMRLGTDGYLALRHGIPAAMLMSIDHTGAASNYHWPTDTPDRVNYDSLAAAVALCELVIRSLAETQPG
jgi:hypothetical protein